MAKTQAATPTKDLIVHLMREAYTKDGTLEFSYVDVQTLLAKHGRNLTIGGVSVSVKHLISSDSVIVTSGGGKRGQLTKFGLTEVLNTWASKQEGTPRLAGPQIPRQGPPEGTPEAMRTSPASHVGGQSVVNKEGIMENKPANPVITPEQAKKLAPVVTPNAMPMVRSRGADKSITSTLVPTKLAEDKRMERDGEVFQYIKDVFGKNLSILADIGLTVDGLNRRTAHIERKLDGITSDVETIKAQVNAVVTHLMTTKSSPVGTHVEHPINTREVLQIHQQAYEAGFLFAESFQQPEAE